VKSAVRTARFVDNAPVLRMTADGAYDGLSIFTVSCVGAEEFMLYGNSSQQMQKCFYLADET
jgi:hypothetical protein